MKFIYVIGMDMSKEFFDLYVHGLGFSKRFINNSQGIQLMLKTLKKEFSSPLDNCLFCFEHTGLYSFEMMVELEKKCLKYSVIPGLALKKSMGISRGKSDTIDAVRIAEYGYLRQEKLALYKLPSKSLMRLNRLASLRTMHVRSRASYMRRLNEQFRVLNKTEYPQIYHSQKRIIRNLDKEIEKVETAIKEIVNQDLRIKEQYNLLMSIKGVGEVIATQMIIKTQCFEAFNRLEKICML